jgi:hypothetical protein
MKDLIASIQRCAQRCVESGETSAEIYAQADEQERTGFGVTASYTRLLAQTVANMEAWYEDRK